MANVSLSAAAQLPLTRSIRHAIRRHKQYTGNPHPIHQDVATMVVPDELKVTSTGDDFLLFDFGPNIGNRIMIFSTARNLDILYNSPHWFADGTFKIVPELFFQHYTIDVLREGSLVTCVYALLSKKQEITYRQLLTELNNLKPGMSPHSIMVDFEQLPQRN